MLQLSKVHKGRKGTVQKVRGKAYKGKGNVRDTDNLRQDLIKKVDHAQAQESKWYEEGKRLKAQYNKLYGE